MSEFANFQEFYQYYLTEHRNRTCRRLHFVGTSLVVGCVLMVVVSGDFSWLLIALMCGYGFAWIGHFFFELNKPATFRYPLLSFASDWVMYKDMLTGKIPF
jgi:hypothetical protein